MQVWLYVDQFATIDSSSEEEYAELEELFRQTFPGHALTFTRDMLPHMLANACPDVYLFDIGGLCYTDYSGGVRINFCKDVIAQVKDHPNTLFIPWSSMTMSYTRDAAEELLPELMKEPNFYVTEDPSLQPQRYEDSLPCNVLRLAFEKFGVSVPTPE